MNTKFALLSTALVAVLTLIILRQTSHYVKTESIIKKYDISSITGQIKDKNMKKDNVTNKVMTNDTHYLLFDMTNFINEKEITATSIKVEVISLSKEIFPMYSQSMMSRFRDSLLFDENGVYLVTPNFNAVTRYKTMQFKYKVK